MKSLTILISFLFYAAAVAQPPGYSFGKQLLIQSSQVEGSSNHLDFPVLISFTDGDLRHTSSGGNVENINGYDIIFTTSNCSDVLSHEIESYDPTNGTYIAWVKIPSLSPTIDYNILMYYGNSSVSSNPSNANTWDAGYDGVWHLNDDFVDASGNGNNGTNNGSTDLSPAKLADGQNFVDPNNWIELTNHPNKTSSFSYSAWFRTNDISRTGQRIICDDETNGSGGHAISLGDPGAGRIRFYIRGVGGTSLDSPSLVSNGVWYYVTATFNTSTGFKAIYLDGVLVASTTDIGTLNSATGNASIGGEVAAGESGNRFQGDLDEIRSYNGVLSPDWIATEFNNQNNPSTFYTISPQFSAAVLCGTLPIELLEFSAQLNLQNEVQLTWKTASEINNDYFTIERSKDASNWSELATINGKGNSSELVEYTYIDQTPLDLTSYYRLKQTDFNGDYSHSGIQTVSTNLQKEHLLTYPNPTNNQVTISGSRNELTQMHVFNLLGQDVTNEAILIEKNTTNIVLSLSNLQSGMYFLKTATTVSKIYKR